MNQYDIRRAASVSATIKSLGGIAGAAVGIYLVLFFFAPRNLLPRLVVIFFVGGAFSFCLFWRITYVRVFGSPLFQRRLLIIGTGCQARSISSVLKEFEPHQYRVVGFIRTEDEDGGESTEDLDVLGGSNDVFSVAQENQISEIVLASPGRFQRSSPAPFFDLVAHGIPVVTISALYEDLTGRLPIGQLDAELMLTSFVEKARPTSSFLFAKRTMDLFVAAIGLLATGCLTLIVAPLIWIETRGPVFYRQTRLGQKERLFEILKFRTMILNAEAPGEAKWASPSDERATRVGRFLRRTRLDELPQFWNVLKGDMSLVGPRPERPEFANELAHQIPFYRLRSIVKPGITGWAQVQHGYGRSVADAATKLEYDLYYIKRQTLWLDMWILLRTAGVVLSFKGH